MDGKRGKKQEEYSGSAFVKNKNQEPKQERTTQKAVMSSENKKDRERLFVDGACLSVQVTS